MKTIREHMKPEQWGSSIIIDLMLNILNEWRSSKPQEIERKMQTARGHWEQHIIIEFYQETFTALYI